MKKALGLVGLLALSSGAKAQDTADTDYMDLSESEVQSEILRRAQRFRYEDIKRLEGNEDFDGVIIASSTCPKEYVKGEDRRRNEIVFLRLMDYFNGTRSVNGDPLVFGYFDICGRSGATELGFNGSSFGMYLDGRRIDTLKGFPGTDEGIRPLKKNMTYWIEYNLINKTEPGEEEIALLYNGTMKWTEVPRSKLME